MAIQASKPVNNMLFVLIGERLIQANEDLARESHAPYRKLSRNLDELADLIEKSIGGAARALPPQAGQNYVRAMRMFVDQGGTAHLSQFSRQLDEIADNRVRTSYQIKEAKWQIIAEVIRLMAELVVVFALSVFSGGAAGRAAVAKARSRVVILTLMDTLMRRTHVLPILSEALEEAFQSFAVRLGMIAFTSGEFSPKGFDWKQIAQDGAFGAFAGAFIAPIAKGSQGVFDGLKRSVKGTTPVKDLAGDVLPKIGRKTDAPTHNPVPGQHPAGTTGTGPAVPVEPSQGRRLSGGSLAVGEAGGESLAEVVGGGLFYGNWATSPDTFVGAGLSNRSEHVLHTGAVGSGTWINTKFSGGQPAGTVNGPDAGLDTGRGAEGEDEQPTAPGSPASGAPAGTGDGSGSDPASPVPTVGSGYTDPAHLDPASPSLHVESPGIPGTAAGSGGAGSTAAPRGGVPQGAAQGTTAPAASSTHPATPGESRGPVTGGGSGRPGTGRDAAPAGAPTHVDEADGTAQADPDTSPPRDTAPGPDGSSSTAPAVPGAGDGRSGGGGTVRARG
ncbi:hypothetical protein PV461_31150, partial [Streptomyces scabiei]|nr:hypothetical protein [Streptomyces scabiei]